MVANFNLPIDLSRLENDRIKLIPFEDNLLPWSQIWTSAVQANPDMYKYLLYGPFHTAKDFATYHDTTIRPDLNTITLAIILKPGVTVPAHTTTSAEGQPIHHDSQAIDEETFAGLSGLSSHPPPYTHLTVDMGQLLLPQYHRTFVGTQTNGLVLHHLLDPPSQGGLGLRRVQWQPNADNTASVNAAKRLGFRLEGVMRWHMVIPDSKSGSRRDREEDVPPPGLDGGSGGGRPGRHSAMLGLCWDDWENGGREHVDRLMAR